MFFVRQHGNHCGLHAIQNMFKSAAVTSEDMHNACTKIHVETGDLVSNHESFGGDWSVSAVITTLETRGYTVYRAVESRQQRTWAGDSLEQLLNNEQFRGMIIHLPWTRHYACLRPESSATGRHLYYVDSQSAGPIRVSPKLVQRRCLNTAYSWEPYAVMGDEMEFVPITIGHEQSTEFKERPRVPLSAEFMRDWHALSSSTSQTKTRGTQ